MDATPIIIADKLLFHGEESDPIGEVIEIKSDGGKIY